MISKRKFLMGLLALPISACSDSFGPMKRIRVESETFPLANVISDCFVKMKQYHSGDHYIKDSLEYNLKVAKEFDIIKEYYIIYPTLSENGMMIILSFEFKGNIENVLISEKKHGVTATFF